MKIINPGFTIIDFINGKEILKKIERIGRVCYKSEDRITDDSAPKFVSMLISRGHEAMLEHYSFSVLFVVDRGVSHEMVRHRLAAFAQESTRYCNYGVGKFGNEITVVRPPFFDGTDNAAEWAESMREAEQRYLAMLDNGASPQEARSVLPNSLKTEIVITANLREWRHILKLRTASVAHPQMQEIMRPLLDNLKQLLPTVFEDIKY